MASERPTVLVDMDGPLADFDKLFFERCFANGWEMDCGPREQRHRFATEHIPNPAHRRSARRMVDHAGWFSDLPVTKGAQAGLFELATHADTWICTKPLEANPTCRDDKARWLVRNFGKEWEKRLIITPDKGMVNGDLLLDDAPKLDWLPYARWAPVIFGMTWNGDGSQWGHLPSWTWGDSIDKLLAHA